MASIAKEEMAWRLLCRRSAVERATPSRSESLAMGFAGPRCRRRLLTKGEIEQIAAFVRSLGGERPTHTRRSPASVAMR